MKSNTASQLLGRAFVTAAVCLLAAASSAHAQPTFSKSFSPSTIGPGSASMLTFTIDATGSGSPVTNLAFTDILPAGVTLATPAAPQTTCSNTDLAAPDGGGTITLSDGELPGGSSCTISVLVTSSTPGTHMNVSGDLTSSAGNSGNATADLTVATDRPGFTKSFSPATAPFGSRSALTFMIDNSANGGSAFGATFTDVLPTGLVIASPSNASTDCTGASLTAMEGTDTISIFGGQLPAGTTCTVSVDVVADGPGEFDNVSSNLTAFVSPSTRSSGLAVDTLESTAGDIVLVKEFLADPVPPGGTVDLEFTILNRTRSDDATDVAFTDNLGDAGGTLTGLAAVGLPATACGGTLSGTSTLSFSGGTVAAASECSFTVTLQVPTSAIPGVYPNVTSNIEADFGFGEPSFGNQASDDLFVLAAPIFTKEFIDDPTTGGGTVTLRFTITNTDSTSDLTDIAFTDDLGAALSGLAANGLVSGQAEDPQPDVCGTGSELTVLDPPDIGPFVTPADPTILVFTGGNLAAAGMPDDSCTFDVVLDVPVGTSSGAYTNTTSELTATPVGTGPASDDLVVVAAPQLTKEFTDDPVPPGGTVTLSFTLFHPSEATGDATGITFTDDLDATLAGLTSIGLPQNDVCGAGSQISESLGVLTLTGGTLAPGATCQISVALQVPMAATAGIYPDTTSTVDATVSGLAVASPAATDDLVIAGLSLAKEFTDDPVIPGGTVTLQFTLVNQAGAPTASNIFFQDNLNAGLSSLAAAGAFPMNDLCGPGNGSLAASAGNTFLTFSGATLNGGETCQFSVTLNVPAGATSSTYPNVTQGFQATIDGNTFALGNAADQLIVAGDVLLLTKTFLTNPVAPGSTVDLEFELTNLSASGTASSIAFTDDLGAALTGLVATGLPVAGCGGTAAANPDAGTIDFSGGTLGPGASCDFTVTVQVPAMPAASSADNTTSTVSGTIGGLGVTGDPATDTLTIQNVDFTKGFDGPTVTGGTAVLTFTIDNLTATPVGNLAFTDDLDAVLPGLVATGLPLATPCGAGSELSGTSFLTFSGGELAGNASCNFNVTVQLPASGPGTFPNTSSALSSAGLAVADPATADLVVEPPPTFAKVFAPDTLPLGQISTLTFTIDNSASALAASSLDFTDSLPAGLAVASPANASTTCTGGTITATAGTGTISYSGGTVSAGSTCTVQADVVANASGSFVNTTGDLTSSSGDSGTASDTLTVDPQPTFSKAFAPASIAIGGVSTLTFTLDNTGSAVLDATGLDFTDNLPAGVLVATPANQSTTCTGGTATATAGSGVVSYTGGSVAAGASCTLTADVTGTAAGSHLNVSGDLTSSLGTSGTATDTLEVVVTELSLTKTLQSSPVLPGGFVDVEYTLTNLLSVVSVSDLAFTDDLDDALVGLQAVTLPGPDPCGAGSTVTGTSVLTLAGGSLPASGSCTFTATLQVPADAIAGSYPGPTSGVTGMAGGGPVMGPAASDTLVVAYVDFTKVFAADVTAGGSVGLQFTLVNPDPANDVTDLAFTDDLDAVIPGMAAEGLPQSDLCGAGSLVSGSSVIQLTGGVVPAGGSCSFTVQVLVPADASGTFVNVTSPLSGQVAGSPITADPVPAEAPLVVGALPIAIPVDAPWALLLLAALLAVAATRQIRLS